MAVGAVNKSAREKLDEIQRAGREPDCDIFEDIPQDEIDRMGAEIYSTLSSLVTGETMVVFRGIPHGNE